MSKPIGKKVSRAHIERGTAKLEQTHPISAEIARELQNGADLGNGYLLVKLKGAPEVSHQAGQPMYNVVFKKIPGVPIISKREIHALAINLGYQLPAPSAVSKTAEAKVRGEACLVNWTQDGTLLEGANVEAAWGVKRQTVDAAREQGEIFSVWVKGKHWYPSEALKFERTTLAAINRALGDINPSSKLLFLLRKHGAIGGQVPADAVVDGKFDDVLRLAAEWART